MSIDGRPLPDGAPVRAFVDGKDCTQPGARGSLVEGNVSVYILSVMHESQEPGCGSEGKTVTFQVGDRPAGQTATWHPGLQHLDLNAGSGQPLPIPPERSVTPGAADRLATATELAKLIPKTGPPPTDDITFRRTAGAGTTGDASGGGGPSPLAVIGGVALVLALSGGVIGLLLARRSRPQP